MYTNLFVEGVTRRGSQVGTSAVAGSGTTFAGKTTWVSSVSFVISRTSRYIKPPFFSHVLVVRIIGLPSIKNTKVVENSSSTTHLLRDFLRIDQVREICKHVATRLENPCAMVVFKLHLCNGIWRVRLQSPRCSISVAVVKWGGWTKHNRTKWASWQAVVEMWFYMILPVSGQIEKIGTKA